MKRVLAFALIITGMSRAYAEETPAPPAGAANIVHVPVTTVVRGQPAHIVADVHAGKGSMIALVRVLTRATDVGTPVPYTMSGGPGDGSYASEIPWSAISGLPRFWYHVEVHDSLGRINSTEWFPVNIIDPPAEDGEAKGALLPQKTLVLAGGLALAGGLVAIGENNDWFKNNDNAPTNTGPIVEQITKDPPKKDKPKLDLCAPGAPPPDVSLDPATLNPFDYLTPIQAKVCGACSSATIRVVTSWNFTASSPVTDLTGCKGGALFSIIKPTAGVANANSEWLQFFDGTKLIYSTSWPDPSFFGPLGGATAP